MDTREVPAYKIVEGKIKEINPVITIEQVVYVFDRMMYIFKLVNVSARKCDVLISREFLDDLNDFTGSKASGYWRNMISELTSKLLGPVEKNGLVPYSKEVFKKLIFEHVKQELQNREHINKFNLLGKPYQDGSLEYFLKVKFDDHERAQAGLAFDELKSQGVLIPTYKDIINPEDWVKINDKVMSQSVTGPEKKEDRPLDNSKRIGDVRFPIRQYMIYHEGLKKLLSVVKLRKKEAVNLGLDDALFTEEESRISGMIEYVEKGLKQASSSEVFISGISLGSLRFLKAGAFMEVLHLEREKSRNSSSRIKVVIQNKINGIKNDVNAGVFENIPPADCLADVEDIETGLTDSPFKYDVVLSYAREDREHVDRLANLLNQSGFYVFYDRFEEANLWGKNLYDYLSDIYRNQGKYCVMFLSKDYARKLWTTHERQNAQERAFKANQEYILPIKIDDTKIPGILDTVGYLDIREKSIEEIFNILKQKL